MMGPENSPLLNHDDRIPTCKSDVSIRESCDWFLNVKCMTQKIQAVIKQTCIKVQFSFCSSFKMKKKKKICKILQFFFNELHLTTSESLPAKWKSSVSSVISMQKSCISIVVTQHFFPGYSAYRLGMSHLLNFTINRGIKCHKWLIVKIFQYHHTPWKMSELLRQVRATFTWKENNVTPHLWVVACVALFSKRVVAKEVCHCGTVRQRKSYFL